MAVITVETSPSTRHSKSSFVRPPRWRLWADWRWRCHDFNNLLTVVNGYADLLVRPSKAMSGGDAQEVGGRARGRSLPRNFCVGRRAPDP